MGRRFGYPLSDGTVKAFNPPFSDVPKLSNEWTVPIAVRECQGAVKLQPGEVF